MALNFAMVPLTLSYLGPERYGIWATISTTVSMFVVLDIGVANTLTNLISKAYARNDSELATRYFATAFWALCGVSTLLGIAALMLWPRIPWLAIFHPHEASTATMLPTAFGFSLLLLLVGLPLGLTTRVLAGYQEIHYANFFSAVGAILGFVLVIIAVKFDRGLTWLVSAYGIGFTFSNLICLAWILLIRKPRLTLRPRNIRKSFLCEIFKSGGQFFMIQMAGLIVFNTDNILISHYLSSAEVTPYNVTWRLVGYAPSLVALSTSALWPAYSEAYQRGDQQWVRKTYERCQMVTITALAAASLIAASVGRDLIRAWAGNSAVPSAPLLYSMCVWMVVYGVSLTQSCLLGATARIKNQAIFASLGAAANLALSVLFVQKVGSSGPVLGSIISYLIFIVLVQEREVRKIILRNWIN